ncbi:MAG: adenylate/guanylate cyclase domain-containing protein [Vulcanimicrobiota bacterium]
MEQSQQQKIPENSLLVLLAIIIFIAVNLLPSTRIIETYLNDVKVFLYQTFKAAGNPSCSSFVLVDVNQESVRAKNFKITYQDSARFLQKMKQSKAGPVVFLFNPRGNATSNVGLNEFAASMKTIPVYLTAHFVKNLDPAENTYIVKPDKYLLSRAEGLAYFMPEIAENKMVSKKQLAVFRNGNLLYSPSLLIASIIKNGKKREIVYQNNALFFGNKTIPTDSDLKTIFIPQQESKFERYSFNDVLSSKKLTSLKNKVVIVGWTARSSPVKVPGIPRKNQDHLYLTVSTAYSILRNNLVTELPSWLNYIILLLLTILLAYYLPRFRSKDVINVYIFLVVSFLVIDIAMFIWGFNLPYIPLLITSLIFTAVLEGRQFFQNRKIGENFVPARLIEALDLNEDLSDMKPQVYNVAVLFVDIKNYTTISERYSPAVIMDTLNEFLKEMNQVVDKHNGVILSYQGDSIITVYGLNGETDTEAAFKASRTALEMADRMNELRRKWQMEYRELFTMGMGICYGEIALGALGDKTFRQFTCIGDTVNLASRLVGVAKKSRVPVVIDDKVHQLVRDKIHCSYLKQSFLKGKFQATHLYKLDDLKDSSGLELSPEVKLDDNPARIKEKKRRYYQEMKDILSPENQ